MLHTIIRNITKAMRMGVYDYGHLESPDAGQNGSDSSMVTKDGSLISMFEILGSYTYAGIEKFDRDLITLVEGLEGTFRKKGFTVEFFFIRDPESGKTSIRPSIDASLESADRMALDIKGLIEQKRNTLGSRVAFEKCLMSIKTDTSCLTPTSANQAFKDRAATVAETGVAIKPGEFSQSPMMVIKALRDVHEALKRTIEEKFSQVVNLRLLDNHELVAEIGKCIGDGAKHHDWKPKLIGDKLSPRTMRESKYSDDISHLLPMDISMQLFNQEVRIPKEEPTTVKYGEYIFCPLSVDIPPTDCQRLNSLVNDADPELPWSLKIRIETGSDYAKSKIGTKQGFASFLAVFSGENKAIANSAAQLLALSENHSLAMVSISACTWAKDMREATRRKSMLIQSLQGWGGAEVIDEAGDPIQAWLTTLPAFSNMTVANKYPMMLEDALYMAPLERPTSPWEAGPCLFRTIDNKPYPYWPSSSKQTASSSIYYAPPGMGKSFLLAANNMGYLTSPGLSELPYLTILDIGFSSKAFVDLVRSMLPEDKKHQALSITYQMTAEYAFNPFDTPLGCRRPLSADRSFLVNFLSLVLTPASAEAEVPRLSELTAALVDAMYDYYSDQGTPHTYEPGADPELDKTLHLHNYFPDDGVTYWDIVDFLFNKGLYREASLAQRFAVPTLNDATAVLSSDPGINELYKNAKHNGEPLLEFVTNMIISAIRDYPVLSMPTAFDMGDARVVSIDLSAVAPSGSSQANKQTSVMYMLARQMTCQEFYRGKAVLNEIPEVYRSYHEAKIEKVASLPKKLCMDEFHRTSSAEQVRSQVKMDIREGRKFLVSLDLLSQMLNDFDEDMIRLVNNIYILSKGNSEDDIRTMEEKFNPSRDSIKAVRQYLNGPGPEGSTLLYLGSLKGEKTSRAEMIIRLTLGASEIWAYSTTPKDIKLRTLLADKVGLSSALRILGKYYPKGSAEADIQNKVISGKFGSIDDIYELLVNKLSQAK